MIQEDAPVLLDMALVKRHALPIVLQSEAMECGLACLSMVMASFGRKLDLNVLRERYPASMRGMSLSWIGGIAEKEGFLLSGYRAPPESLGALKLPSILHWQENHFVVLAQYVRNKRVVIHDPSVGVRKLVWSEFVTNYSGACSELEPLATMKKETLSNKLPLSALVSKVHGYSGTLLKMGAMALILEALILVSPLFLQTVVDEVIPVRDERLLYALALGFCGVCLVSAIVRLVHGWLGMALAGMLSVALKQMSFSHMLKLPLSWFEKRGVGTVTARFRSLDNIRTVLSENILLAVIDGAIVVFMTAFLFIYQSNLEICVGYGI